MKGTSDLHRNPKGGIRVAWSMEIRSAFHENRHPLPLVVKAKFGCSTFLLCLDGGEAYNERVITVGIGCVLLASATSGFSGYIKLAYCSSAKGAPVAQLVRASD